MIGMNDDEGTLFSFSNMNITTDEEFLGYVQSKWVFKCIIPLAAINFSKNASYFPDASLAQISEITSLYPQDPTQGSPFGTGTEYELTPEYKRMAAFQGDLMMASPRRFWLADASSTQNVWGWLNKKGKNANEAIGAFHGSDNPIWFTTTDGTDGMDALLNFVNTLDPNGPSNGSAGVLWPKWNTSSSGGSSSLLTFNDDGINITADTFRTEGIDFLNNLRLTEAEKSS
ncbi:Carboxylic ester hydrolase [Mycena sanguinolenta]|uniref:Carboxylic ester hydrolase n=1 Tax=Mycena sanguinolenta TaxID=230812 RepID=A0A8H7CSL2_9AGAR|nr:Carboxylic ester hydrolase [Mycena sanguinolenta]